MILQLELTLRWNHVRGLDEWGSVGQLIPFVVGVGGLGFVLLRWVGRVVRERRRAWGRHGVTDSIEGVIEDRAVGVEVVGEYENFGIGGDVRRRWDLWKKSVDG